MEEKRDLGKLPAYDVVTADSTCAGDAFHAAVALVLAGGVAWEELLRLSLAVGALACTRLGARCGLADRDAVDTLMKLAHA